MKLKAIKAVPRLFALRDIEVGEELTYDYGVKGKTCGGEMR